MIKKFSIILLLLLVSCDKDNIKELIANKNPTKFYIDYENKELAGRFNYNEDDYNSFSIYFNNENYIKLENKIISHFKDGKEYKDYYNDEYDDLFPSYQDIKDIILRSNNYKVEKVGDLYYITILDKDNNFKATILENGMIKLVEYLDSRLTFIEQ